MWTKTILTTEHNHASSLFWWFLSILFFFHHIISISAASAQPPRIIEPVKRTYASVTLEWHYDEEDPAQPAFITGYLVTVQKVQTDARLGHAASEFIGKL